MYDTKLLIKNAFRVSKVRGETAVRLRVPGGHMQAEYLSLIQELAEEFGNGTVHLTTRQGYEIPGIKLTDRDAVKRRMATMIERIERDCNVVIDAPEQGYPSAGTRNISACVGNRLCRFANFDTSNLARKIEKEIYPNDYHLKVAVTGCPNDCIKAHMQDIGIIGNVVPDYDEAECIACEACMDNCRKKITNALSIDNCRITRDEDYCIGCGECILKCPTGAFSRGRKLYRVVVGGRTGKRNPRLANTFIESAEEEVVMALFKNVYRYIDMHIDRSKPKEHMGYIVDRTGFTVFRDSVLEGVRLNPEAIVHEVENPGYVYPRRS
ncbi:MAG: sulfite reductase subunit C [Phycisphaerae bacterium]|jgi:anaerobic sulfite reductase subunit C|nr:sulfite reductase subunit C [Phycisphaerae bacterium]